MGCAGERNPALKFEIVRNSAGEYYWHLKAANGQIIAYSGETYATKVGAEHALNLVKSSAASAEVVNRS